MKDWTSIISIVLKIIWLLIQKSEDKGQAKRRTENVEKFAKALVDNDCDTLAELLQQTKKRKDNISPRVK